MIKTFDKSLEFLLFLAICFFILVLSFGKNYSFAIQNGLELWVACVLPALFPYFFLTAILSSLNITGKLANKLSPLTCRVFNCGGATGYLFLISLISGYPTGAKGVSDAKAQGLISETEAIRASTFCSTSSPAFIISSVGNIMFNDKKFGLILFCCHLLSAIIVGFIFSFYKRSEKPSFTANFLTSKTDSILYESVYGAVISILVVGGIIVIFTLLIEVLFSFICLPPFIKAIFSGLIECTSGLKLLAESGVSFALPICAFFCGFGGFSVICQSLAFLKKAKIKTTPFLISKVLSGVVNFCFASVCYFIFFI